MALEISFPKAKSWASMVTLHVIAYGLALMRRALEEHVNQAKQSPHF